MRILRSSVALTALLFIWGCGGSDSSGPPPVAGLSIQSGGTQKALAGTSLNSPVVILLKDASGNPVGGQTVTFTVLSGGGFLSSNTGTTNPDGTITAPAWTLGKSAIAQQMQASVNGQNLVVDAAVQTDYPIDVRFFGRPLSANQQALFTTAAARVRAMIVGAVPPVQLNAEDVTFCTGSGVAPVTTRVDGLMIFASIDSIDGPGKTLAQAGPCAYRDVSDFRTIFGVMKFDSADVSRQNAQDLEQTITHEMLHVVGFGVFWDAKYKNLLSAPGQPGDGYTGAGGIAGCRGVGGTTSCAVSVPVEDCVGRPASTCGPGTQDSHWKESTFGTELMTGYLNNGFNALSAMTIKSFEDLGYTVNVSAADTYTIFIGSLSTGAETFSSPAASRDWERPIRIKMKRLPSVRPEIVK